MALPKPGDHIASDAQAGQIEYGLRIVTMRMTDGGDADDKIIAVAEGDPSVNHINDISELPAHFVSEMKNFFENYTKLEKKEVVVDQFQNRKVAEEILLKAMDDYKKKFGA